MRVAFVQTYPIYHEHWSREEWLQLENRDRWMPGIAASMGHEVELWGLSEVAGTYLSRMEGFGDYRIRLFEPSGGGAKTKFHYSDELVRYARYFDPDVCVLKGVDGGAGIRLIKKNLNSTRKPLVFVIGGKYYTRYVPSATVVFYETEYQHQALLNPGKKLWRRPVKEDKLIRLPKSIDTDRFRPMPEEEKEWDVLSVGRLIPLKNYHALGVLAERVRVAVVGGGPAESDLRAKYPKITWLGKMPNREIPAVMNQARVFMHTGLSENFPRVLAEAAACGLPRVAFIGGIAPEVIPPDTGLLVDRSHFLTEVVGLLDDQNKLVEMSNRSRELALRKMSKFSSREALEKMFKVIAERDEVSN